METVDVDVDVAIEIEMAANGSRLLVCMLSVLEK